MGRRGGRNSRYGADGKLWLAICGLDRSLFSYSPVRLSELAIPELRLVVATTEDKQRVQEI